MSIITDNWLHSDSSSDFFIFFSWNYPLLNQLEMLVVLILLLPRKHIYLPFKLCAFCISSPFTISITSILVQLPIAHQKYH